MLRLKSASELAVASIRGAQGRYKKEYDKHIKPASFQLDQWVFILYTLAEVI